MDLIKITPDKERAKSILQIVALIEERIKLQDKKRMTALIIADYYEIIKELITAILLIEGYKILSHKDLIGYFKDKYKELSNYEFERLNDLRILRNKVAYEGAQIDINYLNRNEPIFKDTINKLKAQLDKRLDNK